ncbi:MAG: SDR family oxidoreductase [Gammaproteobacteria bacterium]|nr:SDR family oxidoreductase [Gammaproteobacteria bacterium]
MSTPDTGPFLRGLFDLTGKHVFLTGASSGLGRRFASTLAAAGARVAMAARSVEKMTSLAAEIRGAGGVCDVYALDVRDRAAIRHVIAEAEAVAPLDVLVNNAGIARPRAPEKLGDAEWDEVYETNLRGPWVLAQAVIAARLADGRPLSIINIASVLGIRAIGHLAPYSAAKAGLINLGRDLCVDVAEKGIRVNALAPGYFATEMNDKWLHSPAGERLRQRIPAKRFGDPAELDGALVFLASDASRYMNGNVITIDGGHTAGM